MRRVITCSILISSFTFATPTLAQSPWIPRDCDYSVMVEALRPNVEGVKSDLSSATYFLNGRFRLNRQLAIVMEVPYFRRDNARTIPFEYYPYYYSFADVSELGNPYIGIEASPTRGPVFVEVGVRLPLVGSIGDLGATLAVDQVRREAFYNHSSSFLLAINLREVSPNGIAYHLRLSPTMMLFDNGAYSSQLWGNYSLGIGYVGRFVRVGTGMSGSAFLNSGSANLGARGRVQIDVHGDFLSGTIRPGWGVRLPLGTTANQYPVVFGLTLAWVH